MAYLERLDRANQFFKFQILSLFTVITIFRYFCLVPPCVRTFRKPCSLVSLFFLVAIYPLSTLLRDSVSFFSALFPRIA